MRNSLSTLKLMVKLCILKTTFPLAKSVSRLSTWPLYLPNLPLLPSLL